MEAQGPHLATRSELPDHRMHSAHARLKLRGALSSCSRVLCGGAPRFRATDLPSGAAGRARTLTPCQPERGHQAVPNACLVLPWSEPPVCSVPAASSTLVCHRARSVQEAHLDRGNTLCSRSGPGSPADRRSRSCESLLGAMSAATVLEPLPVPRILSYMLSWQCWCAPGL